MGGNLWDVPAEARLGGADCFKSTLEQFDMHRTCTALALDMLALGATFPDLSYIGTRPWYSSYSEDAHNIMNWSMCLGLVKKMTWNSNRTSSDFLTSIVLPRAIGIARCNSTGPSHRRRRWFSTCLPRRWRLGNAKAGHEASQMWCAELIWPFYTYILYTYYTLVMITYKSKYSIQYTSHWITCKLIKAHCKHIVSSCTAFCDILQQSID
jgi:hypothetical protein